MLPTKQDVQRYCTPIFIPDNPRALHLAVGIVALLALHCAAGHLTGMDYKSSLLLGGVNVLLLLPVYAASVGGGALAGGIVGGLIHPLSKKPFTSNVNSGAEIGRLLGAFVSVVALFALSRFVCDQLISHNTPYISSVCSFSFHDSFKVLGHVLWMGAALALINHGKNHFFPPQESLPTTPPQSLVT